MSLPAYKLWRKYITEPHLKSLFQEKIRKKEYVGMDWITLDHFSQHLDEEIQLILRKASSGEYHFTTYREFLISKGAKKLPRCISIPTIRDRILLAAMNDIITEAFGKPAVSPMPQVVVSEIQKALLTKQYDSFIKIDISSFYSSIDHDLLLQALSGKIKKKELRSLIYSAISTPTIPPNCVKRVDKQEKGLPEGLSISNSLANIFMMKVDNAFSQEKKSYMYWRYVDDILILTNKDTLESVERDVKQTIGERKLSIENSKSYSGKVHDGFEYLGYLFSNDTISVKRDKIVSLERSIDELFRDYNRLNNKDPRLLRWKVNLRITGFILDDNKYGWMFFYSQISESEIKCLFHLDWFIKKLLSRYSVDGNGFKRFVRTYFEINKAVHNTKYIINLDSMSIREKRNVVSEIYGEDVKNKDTNYIERRFRALITRELRDIQKDVQTFS